MPARLQLVSRWSVRLGDPSLLSVGSHSEIAAFAVSPQSISAVQLYSYAAESHLAIYNEVALLSNGVVMKFQIEIEQETDGRWLAEIEALPGVASYGTTRTDAVARVQALALRVLAEKLEHGEAVPEFLEVSFQAA